MASREAKETPHFIQVFAYSGIQKHFTEVEPGALIMKFKCSQMATYICKYSNKI